MEITTNQVSSIRNEIKNTFRESDGWKFSITKKKGYIHIVVLKSKHAFAKNGEHFVFYKSRLREITGRTFTKQQHRIIANILTIAKELPTVLSFGEPNRPFEQTIEQKEVEVKSFKVSIADKVHNMIIKTLQDMGMVELIESDYDNHISSVGEKRYRVAVENAIKAVRNEAGRLPSMYSDKIEDYLDKVHVEEFVAEYIRKTINSYKLKLEVKAERDQIAGRDTSLPREKKDLEPLTEDYVRSILEEMGYEPREISTLLGSTQKQTEPVSPEKQAVIDRYDQATELAAKAVAEGNKEMAEFRRMMAKDLLSTLNEMN